MGEVLAFLGVVLTGLLSFAAVIYTARQGRRVKAAEDARLAAEKRHEESRKVETERIRVEAEAYLRARGIDDQVVQRLERENARLDEDLQRLAQQAAEREAHAVQNEQGLRAEIAALRVRSSEAERRAREAEERALEAERRAHVAERAVSAMRDRLDAIERRGSTRG